MIKIENVEVTGWETAIRGMRNPLNSWDRSDSHMVDWCELDGDDMNCDPHYHVGDNDKELMLKLAKAGSTHAKYRRMIVVYADITAPLYWWKEFDTYKVGTVANSCSTMHKIHDKEFTLDNFSVEHLDNLNLEAMKGIIHILNICRDEYNETNRKDDWWQMIQLLPSSYNQRRTVMMNYEVLSAMYRDRKWHKLDEWLEFCKWIKALPHSEIIIEN